MPMLTRSRTPGRSMYSVSNQYFTDHLAGSGDRSVTKNHAIRAAGASEFGDLASLSRSLPGKAAASDRQDDAGPPGRGHDHEAGQHGAADAEPGDGLGPAQHRQADREAQDHEQVPGDEPGKTSTGADGG